MRGIDWRPQGSHLTQGSYLMVLFGALIGPDGSIAMEVDAETTTGPDILGFAGRMTTRIVDLGDVHVELDVDQLFDVTLREGLDTGRSNPDRPHPIIVSLREVTLNRFLVALTDGARDQAPDAPGTSSPSAAMARPIAASLSCEVSTKGTP